jgi:hypothetical protein
MDRDRLKRIGQWEWFGLIFCVAALVRGLIVVMGRTYASGEAYEMVRVAMTMASQGEYADPYMEPTGPTAVAPGYTLILAGIYSMLGPGLAAEICKAVLSIGVVSAQYALLPWLAGR